MKLESNIKNMALVLTIISIVAGGALAAVNSITSRQIEKINKENLDKGIKEVLGVGENDSLSVSEETDSATGYVFYTTDRGTAVKTTSNGFGGPIEILTGFDTEGTILGYKVLSHAETPGLGAKVSEWFQKGQKGDIIGKNPGQCNLTVSKDGGDIDAITASTITSRAFLRGVQAAYDSKFGEGADALSGASKQEHQCKGECGDKCEGKCKGDCKDEHKKHDGQTGATKQHHGKKHDGHTGATKQKKGGHHK